MEFPAPFGGCPSDFTGEPAGITAVGNFRNRVAEKPQMPPVRLPEQTVGFRGDIRSGTADFTDKSLFFKFRCNQSDCTVAGGMAGGDFPFGGQFSVE